MQLGKVDTKVTPEVLTAINQIEMAERLGDIFDLLSKRKPKGNIRPYQLVITTTPQMFWLVYSATLVNDGPGNVYLLQDNRAIMSDDAPLKPGERFEIDLKEQQEQNGILYWLVTDSGTTILRVFGGE